MANEQLQQDQAHQDVSASIPTAASSDATTPSSPQPGTKRKKLSRTALTLREKAIVKSFCEQKVTDCKARGELVPSQEVLRREVATRFGWSCGRSTLSKIISMDWKTLRGSHEGGDAPRNPDMKRRRRPLFPAFEADLVKFILAHLAKEGGNETATEVNTGGDSAAEDNGTTERKGRPLTEALILEEAQRLKQVHNVSDEMLVLSVGWLARFKHRHSIRLRKPAGTSSKGSLTIHQQLGSGDGSGAELGSMGAWNIGLIAGQMQGASEQSVTNQSSTNTKVSEDNSDDLLAMPTQRTEKVELTDGSTRPTVLKRTVLCSAQWLQGHSAKRPATTAALLEQIPENIRDLACSCQGSAIDDDFSGALTGLRVAVVGFGCVVDAFLAAAKVGVDGRVICVDASPASVYLAEQAAENFCLGTLGLPAVNVKFIVGEYGGMSQSPSSPTDLGGDELKNLLGQIDLAICNCSIQALEFPASKSALLELAFTLLKVGGELRVTDLVCSRRLTSAECEEARIAVEASAGNESLAAGRGNSKQIEQKLLLDAPYVGDLRRLFRALSGCDVDVRTIMSCSEADAAAIDVAVASLLPSLVAASDARFRRVTFRAFRLQYVEEDPREDYGQTALFKGSDEGDTAGGEGLSSYRLDDDWNFQKGVCAPIDGNTAQILQTSWMQRYFDVSGDRSRHRGPFFAGAHSTSSPPSVALPASSASEGAIYSGETVVTAQSSLALASSPAEPLEMVNI